MTFIVKVTVLLLSLLVMAQQTSAGPEEMQTVMCVHSKKFCRRNPTLLVPITSEDYGVRCCSETRFKKARYNKKCNLFVGVVKPKRTKAPKPNGGGKNGNGGGNGRGSSRFLSSQSLGETKGGKKCVAYTTFTKAERSCARLGARLCTQEETLNRCTIKARCGKAKYIWTLPETYPTVTPTDPPSEAPSYLPSDVPSEFGLE